KRQIKEKQTFLSFFSFNITWESCASLRFTMETFLASGIAPLGGTFCCFCRAVIPAPPQDPFVKRNKKERKNYMRTKYNKKQQKNQERQQLSPILVRT